MFIRNKLPNCNLIERMKIEYKEIGVRITHQFLTVRESKDLTLNDFPPTLPVLEINRNVEVLNFDTTNFVSSSPKFKLNWR
uniref:Uncharacterized protein n=1 Tax=Romanomermis culicivorax TaxID=13658 RepID=A0A915I368_ROMCU